MKSFQITGNEAGQRFDKYLKKLLSQAPGSFVYKMLRKKNITLNGKKADGSEKLNIGDEVKLFLADETFEKFSAWQSNAKISENSSIAGSYPSISLDIIYEDDDILVINKPTGMLSQKAAPTDISANEYIIGYLLSHNKISENELMTFHPSVCNRLDRNTSGLLIAGKSLKGLQEMSKQLKERSTEKYYRCLVKGQINDKQLIEGWLVKEEKSNKVKVFSKERADSKYIKTGYRPMQHFFIENGASKEDYTLLEVHLITGRSHQIRAHLATIGHPIVGDGKYGDRKVNSKFAKELGIQSQLLHAYRMKLADGRELKAPLGKEFQKVLEYLE